MPDGNIWSLPYDILAKEYAENKVVELQTIFHRNTDETDYRKALEFARQPQNETDVIFWAKSALSWNYLSEHAEIYKNQAKDFEQYEMAWTFSESQLDKGYLETTEKGKEIVKEFESFSAKPYKDPVGIPTIGYGHTKGVSLNDPPITHEKALELLDKDLKEAEDAIHDLVKVQLNQEQFDALASWTFNLGYGNLQSSTLLKKLNEKEYREVPSEMKRWVYADGRKLNGLIRRREKEAKLFEEGNAKMFG